MDRFLARYLVRLANDKHHSPEETGKIAHDIRLLLGSKSSIGHLRISNSAVEFDLFASDSKDLASKRSVLEDKIAKALTVKSLDVLPTPRNKLEVLQEGIGLFNEERFWECHEVLEQIWHPAKGSERDVVQGLILTAAALVHYQRAEDEVCLSMLKKAREKLGTATVYESIDLERTRLEIQSILESKNPGPFRIPIQT